MVDAMLNLPDGRSLGYTDLGAPDGPLVFYFHGAPSSRLDLVAFEDQFTNRGVRVVCPDRPGYGTSSRQVGRQREHWPADVAALADALGRARFAVCGISSGGPYTLACAALLRDRVVAATVVAGVTDVDWSGFFDQYDDLWPGLKELMGCPDERTAQLWCDEHYGIDGSRFAEHVPALGPADRAFLRDRPMVAAFMRSMAEAMRQGTAAFAQDILIENRPWSFDPGTIEVPVRVVHGAGDTLLPVGHSRHTAEVIPISSFEIMPEHGHISIFGEFPAFTSHLASHVA
jgi:pimeloyl-ACP methyl ester carboxylesterase